MFHGEEAVVQPRVVGQGARYPGPQSSRDATVDRFGALGDHAPHVEVAVERVGGLEVGGLVERRGIAERLEDLGGLLGDVERADHPEDRRAFLRGDDVTGRERPAVGVAVHLELDRQLGATAAEEVRVRGLRPPRLVDRLVGGVQRLRGDETTEEVPFDMGADVDREAVTTDEVRP
jgi:hypothetical protein